MIRGPCASRADATKPYSTCRLRRVSFASDCTAQGGSLTSLLFHPERLTLVSLLIFVPSALFFSLHRSSWLCPVTDTVTLDPSTVTVAAPSSSPSRSLFDDTPLDHLHASGSTGLGRGHSLGCILSSRSCANRVPRQ